MRASACASPGKAEGGTGSPPPKKKPGGEGGGARVQPTATKPPANTTRGGQTPHPEGTEDRTPKEAQGDHQAKTGNTKPGTAAHREKGHRNMQTHTTLEKTKKEPAAQPERKGMGGKGPQGPGQGQPATNTTKPNQDTPKTKKRRKKTHCNNATKRGRGRAETRAQHARPHNGPQPGKAGNKRGARTNTHPRTATPTRRCRRPRGTGARAHTHPNTPPRRGGAQPKPKPQHARPHRTPEPEAAGGKWSAHAITHVP